MAETVQSIIALEQCSVCSGHYEQGRKSFPQPDLNRLICKLLNVTPQPLPDGSSYFSNYIPTCVDCIKKIRKYDRLRVELEVLRREVVSSVIDTLVHIRPSEDTPLDPIKEEIVKREAYIHILFFTFDFIHMTRRCRH